MYSLEIAHKVACVFDTVVYASEERVFYRYSVTCFFLIGLQRLAERSCRIALVYWHEEAAHIVVSRVQ